MFKNCKYYDQASLNNFFDDPNKKNLIVMHFNVRSFAKNIDKLNECIYDLKTKPSVIAITETKLNQNRMSANINIYGYSFIHHDSKTCAGGVALYIEESLKYVQSNKTSLNLDNVEDLWIELTINKKPYLIGVIHRHPENKAINIEKFSVNIHNLFQAFNSKKLNFCVV